MQNYQIQYTMNFNLNLLLLYYIFKARIDFVQGEILMHGVIKEFIENDQV